jgi:alkylated DNA repair dioxygenase AlkB
VARLEVALERPLVLARVARQPAPGVLRVPVLVEEALGGRPGVGHGRQGRTIGIVPEGLAYIEEFITPEEERAVLDAFEAMDFRTLTMRGQTAKRTVRHFGLDYDYESGELVPADTLPQPLEFLRERCAALIERHPPDLAQILVSRYPEGAGIGWHRDAPMFGSRIAGVSLLAPCRMRFQRTVKGERETAAVELAPRSAYVLSGKARWSWQHSIPATKALRYSVTFRTLKRT